METHPFYPIWAAKSSIEPNPLFRRKFLERTNRPCSGAATITVTRNEILYSLNKPEDFILGIVEFLEGGAHRVHYVREPFQREPDFGACSVNYSFAELLAKAEAPS